MAKPSAVNHARMVSAVVADDGLTSHTSMPRSNDRGFDSLLNSSKAETAYCSGQQRSKQGIVMASINALSCVVSHRGLLASAFSLASLPAIAQEEGSADELAVMSMSLADVVKPTLGFQGALQGAGTPNQAGVGPFLPLSVGDNSVWFLDALANVNFADRAGARWKVWERTMRWNL